METSCKNLVQENQGVVRDLLIEDDVSMSTTASVLNILELPESIALQIFGYLPFSSIGAVGRVCTLWNRISQDELLWRHVFLRHYKLPVTTTLPAKARSWRTEFKRLFYHTPAVLVEERKEHKDEVLHVSFSHDGTMFATCSKDGYFKVWECTHPVRLLFKMDMKSSFSWKFTQFSQFNETDTCLLVSGVYFGRLSTSGEIAVFNLQDDFRMQCRVTNKPYDVFGAWYDNDHLLSGTLYWTGDFNSVSAVWLSKASQEVESEVESVSMVLYRFENVNSSSIRLLHVAEVDKDVDLSDNCADRDDQELSEGTSWVTAHGSMKQSASDPEGASYRSALQEQSRSSSCILDRLLRRTIAEDEFDLENEDKTDDEEVSFQDMVIDEATGAQDHSDSHGMTFGTVGSSAYEILGEGYSMIGGDRSTSNMMSEVSHGTDAVILQSDEKHSQMDMDFCDGTPMTTAVSNVKESQSRFMNSDEVSRNAVSLPGQGKPDHGSANSKIPSQDSNITMRKDGSRRNMDSCDLPMDRTIERKRIDDDQRSASTIPAQTKSETSCGFEDVNSNQADKLSQQERIVEDHCRMPGLLCDEAMSISGQSSNLYQPTANMPTSLSTVPSSTETNLHSSLSQSSCTSDHKSQDFFRASESDQRLNSEHFSQRSSDLSQLEFLATDRTNLPSDMNENCSIPLDCSRENSTWDQGERMQKIDQANANGLATHLPCSGDNIQIRNEISHFGENETSIVPGSSSVTLLTGHERPLSSISSTLEPVASSSRAGDSGKQEGATANPLDCDKKDESQQFDSSEIHDASSYSVPCLFDDNLVMLIPGASHVYGSRRYRDEFQLANPRLGGNCYNDNNNNTNNNNNFYSHSVSDSNLSVNLSTELDHLDHLGFEACSSSSLQKSIATQTDVASRASSFHSLSHASHSSSVSRDLHCAPPREKLLIYTWGSETYIPHKIGIKRMKCTDFNKGEAMTARRSSMLLPDVMENLHNMAGNRRDKPDVTIEMHGHIVGLSLSPDHKFLYVNCRPWPKNYIISDPQESPPLAQEVEISTIDLTTFEFVGPVLRSHKAYTHSDECFFLNLDVSDDYVASGAEDRQGYLWDRHYGIPLYHFPHRNVVNCVAINPQDPETLVTVSDDYTFKVWMSRSRAREVTSPAEHEPIGTSV